MSNFTYHNSMKLKQALEFLKAAKYQQTIDVLSVEAGDDKTLASAFISLQSRLNNLKNQNLKGVISQEDLAKEYSSWVQSVLILIENWENPDVLKDQFKTGNKDQLNTKSKIFANHIGKVTYVEANNIDHLEIN